MATGSVVSKAQHLADLAATNAAIGTQVQAAITTLKGTAGSALDTLGEIQTALGGDANLATTLTKQIADKAGRNSVAHSIASTGGLAPDTTLLPFSANSVWRLGIAADAKFATAGDARNVALGNVDQPGQAWINSDNYSHPIAYPTGSDPYAAVTDSFHTVGGIPEGGTWNLNIPATARIAAGTDRHMHVMSLDRNTIYEHFGAVRTDSTHYTVTRRHAVALNGSGLGPQNGTRAYGGSAIGGLIRAWEVDPTNPNYTGRIDHPLAIAIRGDQALYTGTDPQRAGGFGDSYGPDGYGLKRGYVWPATEQDYGSSSNYSGPIPMGAYFAIPPTVDLTTLGLASASAMMMAKACQDYGVYVTDTSGTTNFYVEDDNKTATGAFLSNLFNGGAYSNADIKILLKALRVVTTNGPETPNGGVLGAARRGVVANTAATVKALTATVAANTTALTGKADTSALTALAATVLPKWQPSTVYASGAYVLNPSGQIVSANTGFTSGTTYSASNWTVTAGTTGGGGGASADDVTRLLTAAGFAGGNYRGTWAQGTAYAVGDIITYENTFLICVTAHTSIATALFRFDRPNWNNLTSQLISGGTTVPTRQIKVDGAGAAFTSAVPRAGVFQKRPKQFNYSAEQFLWHFNDTTQVSTSFAGGQGTIVNGTVLGGSLKASSVFTTTITATRATAFNITGGHLRVRLRVVTPAAAGRYIKLRLSSTGSTFTNYLETNVVAAEDNISQGIWQTVSLPLTEFSTTGTGADITAINGIQFVTSDTVDEFEFSRVSWHPNTADIAKVILWLDDGIVDHIQALKIAAAYGFPVTFASIAENISNGTVFNGDDARYAQNQLGAQWATHAFGGGDHNTPQSGLTLLEQVLDYQHFALAMGLHGAEDGAYWSTGYQGSKTPDTTVTAAKVFRSMRGGISRAIETLPPGNPMNTRAYLTGGGDTSAAQWQPYVQKAINSKGLAQLVWHAMSSTLLTEFATLCAWLDTQRANIKVVTPQAAYDPFCEVGPSNLPTAVTPVEVATTANSGTALTLTGVGVQTVTMTGNATFTFPSLPSSGVAKTFVVILKQDGTGGRTATWPATVKWPGAVAPTLSIGANKVDVFTFVSADATTWLGFTGALDVR